MGNALPGRIGRVLTRRKVVGGANRFGIGIVIVCCRGRNGGRACVVPLAVRFVSERSLAMACRLVIWLVRSSRTFGL
jgi:hypothetical protein